MSRKADRDPLVQWITPSNDGPSLSLFNLCRIGARAKFDVSWNLHVLY